MCCIYLVAVAADTDGCWSPVKLQHFRCSCTSNHVHVATGIHSAIQITESRCPNHFHDHRCIKSNPANLDERTSRSQELSELGVVP